MSDGHRDRWSPPPAGWPTFDSEGRRVDTEARRRDAESLEEHYAAIGDDMERQRLDDLDWERSVEWE